MKQNQIRRTDLPRLNKLVADYIEASTNGCNLSEVLSDIQNGHNFLSNEEIKYVSYWVKQGVK